MKIFTPLYRRAMIWSRHPHAVRYLAGVSFIESSFFPVPTAIMLAPMVLAQRERAWRLAAVATAFSVLGGVFGYFIGYFFFEQIGRQIIDFYHAGEKFAHVQIWYDRHGAWLVLLAAVTPIPYKVFTIASGLLAMPLAVFVLASAVGRAAQFFLVAGLLWWGGERIEKMLAKWAEPAGWGVLALGVAGYLLVR
ncbi:MAG: DedA family protein [Gammaproteobacteria bacterium]